jgi:uncharacterized membrane protein YhiD involved in acid resistance
MGLTDRDLLGIAGLYVLMVGFVAVSTSVAWWPWGVVSGTGFLGAGLAWAWVIWPPGGP